MNYRSIADLNRTIVENLYRVPTDVDLIVGVPRSGMLAATMLATHLNLPLTDVQGYLENRIMDGGIYFQEKVEHRSRQGYRKALIVDDSILSGREMAHIRELIESAGLTEKTLFSAVFCNSGTEKIVDLAFSPCPVPHVFEWHLARSYILPDSCVDIDGVLCIDPTKSQDDDGEKYHEFLRTALPLLRTKLRIGTLVTSRLEKYRSVTQEWLAAHDVEYDNLIMMQYDTLAEREADQTQASFKANAYIATEADLFIESSDPLAAKIARLSGKKVLCFQSQRMYHPSGLPYAAQRAQNLRWRVSNRVKRVLRELSSVFSIVK